MLFKINCLPSAIVNMELLYWIRSFPVERLIFFMMFVVISVYIEMNFDLYPRSILEDFFLHITIEHFNCFYYVISSSIVA